MLIERALPGDAEALSEIAMLSKGHWGYPQRWMELWRVSLTVDPRTIRENPVYILEEGGDPAGFYVLLGKPPELDLDQLWVLPRWIGHGFGGELVRHALRLAAEMGAQLVTVQAEPHAENFYLHMGARRVGAFEYELEGLPRILPRLVFDLVQPETGSR